MEQEPRFEGGGLGASRDQGPEKGPRGWRSGRRGLEEGVSGVRDRRPEKGAGAWGRGLGTGGRGWALNGGLAASGPGAGGGELRLEEGTRGWRRDRGLEEGRG